MAIVTGDRYLEKLVKFLDEQAEPLIEATKVLKLNPAGLHYVHLRLDALQELESMLSGAPVDYLRAYVSDLGDFRALEQLRRILRLLTSLKVVSTLPPPARDPTPLCLLPFGRLKVLELRGCDLSTSAAKGLLELRHTLEKIICHNSTDALRHIFASRISDIKDSPQWNKLAFVSCACNRVVLMDESLQLLPSVESLDLSRNKFAKVDNLRRCTKLKHLDLGFNHLRKISHFSEVSCCIVKLVLRNNALTTLRGIENLKLLEGLDVSYNIISNFSELEFLGSLSLLRNLWLEGNPLCCARWYRAHVFSYFTFSNDLKLDGKEIGTREFWKRQIILARRQKQPPGYGFYSPARDEAEDEGSGNRKKKKVSRLASIDSEEESTYISSDQESASCDHETQNKEENVKSDNEADIFGLINKVEHLKKERSVLWLREFKEWMANSSEDLMDVSNNNWGIHPEIKHHAGTRKSQTLHGETSRSALGSVQESETNNLESDGSVGNLPTGTHSVKDVEGDRTRKTIGGISSLGIESWDLNQKQQIVSHDETNAAPVEPNNLHAEMPVINKPAENGNVSTLNTIDDMTGSYSSSTYLGSPPHYRKDVLRRRHDLVEEILQLSADSVSVATSDSMSSCSEDLIYDTEQSNHEDDQLLDEVYLDPTAERYVSDDSKDNADCEADEIPSCAQEGADLLHFQSESSSIIKTWKTEESTKAETNNFLSGFHNAELASFVNQIGDWLEKKKNRGKPRKNVVSLVEDDNVTNGVASQRRNAYICGFGEDGFHGCFSAHIQEHSAVPALISNTYENRFLGAEQTVEGTDDRVEDYFRTEVSDSSTQETCRLYMHCNCILERDSSYEQREVVLLLSSEEKLFVLLVDISAELPERSLSLLRSHRVEDIKDISVGLGLQVVRLRTVEETEYIFVTRSIEKTKELFNIIQVFNSQVMESKCSIGSMEQFQVELFEKEICGGVKLNIFLYNVLHFQSSALGGESWLPRSLFVAGGHLFICIEEFMQLRAMTPNAASAPYFSLDSSCSIADIYEMVIDAKGSACLVLRIVGVRSGGAKTRREGRVIWKLKWLNRESVVKVAALLKALHPDTPQHPLLVQQLGQR